MNLLTTAFLINLVQNTWQTTIKPKYCTYSVGGYAYVKVCESEISPDPMRPNTMGTSRPYYDDIAPDDVIKHNYDLDDGPGDASMQTEENRKVLVLMTQKLYNKMLKKALDKYDNDKSEGKSKLFFPREALPGAKVLYDTIQKNYINSDK